MKKNKECDYIIDIEKYGVSINGESLYKPIKYIKILSNEDLIWESWTESHLLVIVFFNFVK